MSRTDVSGVLLAGGKSSRMGTNKALLRFPDGRTVIEQILSVVAPLCRETLIVTNTPEEYAFLGVRMVPDEYPGASSLGGIYTGLLHAEHDWAVALSCDLPLVKADVLARLFAASDAVDLVMPFIGGRQQPLHALYSKRCLAAMRAQIEAGDLKIVRLLETLHGRVLEETELADIPGYALSFRNMNTPEDWAEIQELGKA